MLALVAVLVMAVLAGLMSLVHSALSQPTTERVHNAAVLRQAKDALIGYVAKEVVDLSNAMPGRLPCPEAAGDAGTSLEGRASGSCAAATTIGRLPWRTLGIDKLVDSSSEPLWYAVSPNWAGSGAVRINPGTPGQLSVDGIPDVVAVIIAPGPAVNLNPTSAQTAAPYSCAVRAQARNDRSHVPTGPNPDVGDYLECVNATVPPTDVQLGSTIVGNDVNPVLNDQLVYITARELLNAIQGPLAERMQRTVAPLLNEFSSGWVASGTILPTATHTTLARFMPYARAFVPPEDATVAKQDHCGGTTPTREGLLPVAAMGVTGSCASPWGGFTWTGSVGATSCTSDAAGAVTCNFRYYTLRSFNIPFVGTMNLFDLLQLAGVPGFASPPTINVALQASAPYAASAFRTTLRATDFTINPAAPITSATFAQTPNAVNGSANLSLQLQVASANLCVDTPGAFNVVCSALTTFGDVCPLLPVIAPFCGLLSAAFTETLTQSHLVSVQFPALSDPTVQGTELSAPVLSAAATAGATPPFDLTNPAAGAPHYWFLQNDWYRYTYYGIAESASAAQAGTALNVSGFPSQFGGPGNKRFILALMGPAQSAQARGPSAALNQYVEGANAATAASPRVYAYQVFDADGNDRVAACPATSICN